jgi:hypothetical protein
MKLFLTILLTIFLNAIPFQVNAWGDEGHKTVGQIAQNFLKPNIATKVANLLQNRTFGGQLSLAALWADKIKGSPVYGWSGVLHFVNSLDDPGHCCAFEQQTDDKGNNIVNGKYF